MQVDTIGALEFFLLLQFVVMMAGGGSVEKELLHLPFCDAHESSNPARVAGDSISTGGEGGGGAELAK